MRRLLSLTCATVLVETVFFAALAPLLPGFADDLGLAKWEAGLLVAAYALGAFLGALPAGALATRWSVRATLLAGLLLVAGASVAFGVVDAYWPLVAARLAQGVGGSYCWTGALAWLVDESPRERRGELIGFAMSAAVGGALLGPALGGAASHFGRLPAFAAVGALCLLLTAACGRLHAPAPGESQPLGILLHALRRKQVLAGMWLLSLPALLFGTLSLLGPLQLDRAGWGVWGVALTFLVAASLEAAVNPVVGRWSDRRGRLAPVRVALVGAIAVSLVLPWLGDRWLVSLFVLLGGLSFGLFWAPTMAMLSDGWEAAGVEHGLGFALMNFAWAPGHIFGSSFGGTIAGAAGDVAAWAVLAAICAATLAALVVRPSRGAVPVLSVTVKGAGHAR